MKKFWGERSCPHAEITGHVTLDPGQHSSVSECLAGRRRNTLLSAGAVKECHPVCSCAAKVKLQALRELWVQQLCIFSALQHCLGTQKGHIMFGDVCAKVLWTMQLGHYNTNRQNSCLQTNRMLPRARAQHGPALTCIPHLSRDPVGRVEAPRLSSRRAAQLDPSVCNPCGSSACLPRSAEPSLTVS